jgi:hypothetical protein
MCIPVQDEDYEQQDKRGCQLNLKAHRLRLLKRKRLKTEKWGVCGRNLHVFRPKALSEEATYVLTNNVKVLI